MNRAIKLAVIFLVPCSLLLSPVPKGLTIAAWQLFAMYMAAILGIMFRPLPEPVIILIIISISSLGFHNLGILLNGYASTTAWLVFTAFMLSQAFVETGLGKRIAFLLIGRMGRSTLGLGYVAALTDLIISPATPSNTARTGGIVYPIFRSIAATLKSEPGPTGAVIGSYLTILLYEISLTTGALFLTAMAPNILVASFAQSILHVDLSWLVWAKGAIVPGLIVLAVIPFLVYKIYPPKLKEIPNAKEIAHSGLAQLGPMSLQEKLLAVFFVLAIIGWATTSITKIDATAIAIAFVSACLFTQIISWDSVLKSKGAWSTLIWYGGIIGLANGLSKANFFKWLAQLVNDNMNIVGYNPVLVLIILLFVSLIVRYLFASTAAYVTTFIPVLFTIGLVSHVPALPLALLIAFSSGFGSLLTHYGGALGPVLFGTGYVDQVTWWKIGTIVVALNIVIYILIGFPYWHMIDLW